ncbi:hypothetical protein A8A54_09965 [Brucella pseudogrignonensis]|uniref:hypothetical protein n=1 Tax=Brucella pseudogrignonensis TaxID=419475 RepID=UPI0007DAB079|nr:hypothetical protein [Brucella pseudogrignonensis]ANG96766.1 hypothetical protein A8A54_09965 [Brucella pseudogrignonensis]
MRQEKFEEIELTRQQISARSEETQDLLTTQTGSDQPYFDQSQIIAGTDYSFSDVQAKITTSLEILSELEKLHASPIVPGSILKGIVHGSNELNEALIALNEKIKQISTTNAGWTDIDYTNFTAKTATGHQVNLLPEFQNVASKSDQFIANLLSLSPLLRPRSGYRFAIAAKELSSIIEKTTSTLGEARTILKQTQNSSSIVSELAKKALEQQENVALKVSESDRDRTTIANFLAKVTEQNAAIEQAISKSTDLETTIEASTEALQLFEKQIEERDKRFKSGEVALTNLLADLRLKEESVDELIEKSGQMLSLATVAGLASNFGQMKKELTKELKWAGYGFYGAIAFLAISAIPLFFLIMMPIAKPFLEYYFKGLQIVEQAALGSSWQYLGQVLGRLLILVPAIWLVKFTSIRYSSLFRLREHYAYKYSMAVAVEGFKKQAPDYGQEITAMVLEQLAFNPVDKLVPSSQVKEGKPPVFLAVLLGKFRQHLDNMDRDLEK